MNWRKSLIAFATRKGYKQFIRSTIDPDHAQKNLWENEIKPLLQKSEFWRGKLKNSLKDYPITEYADYAEVLEIAKKVKISPLNGEPIIFWAETSGTSGERKHFPMTKSFQTQFQRTMAPFLHSLTQRFPGFFKSPTLYLASVTPDQYMPSGVPSGWISSYNYHHMSPLVKSFYALPYKIMSDSEKHVQWAPLYALATDLSSFFSITPLGINDFYRSCQSRFAEFYDYLMGKKKIPDDLPPLTISKARREYLAGLNPAHSHSFATLWPDLEFCCCWTSGLCAPSAENLRQLLGGAIKLIDTTYSSTEGWVSVPLSDDKKGGALHPGAHIFEFIEEGQEIRTENLIPCSGLKAGKKYEIFLTTAMGFVRYRLKDTIECTGHFNQAPWIEFCYKAQQLRLEYVTLTSQNIEEMLAAVKFEMKPYWYFARESKGNRLVLITDTQARVHTDELRQMHQALKSISQNYEHQCNAGLIIEPTQIGVPLSQLLKNKHAQTKPKLINAQEVW